MSLLIHMVTHVSHYLLCHTPLLFPSGLALRKLRKRLHGKFYDRLRARGYPSKFLLKCFTTVSYSLRPQLISAQPSNKKPPSIVLKLHYFPHIKKHQKASLNPPLVCWVNGTKLRCHLVQSSFPPT